MADIRLVKPTPEYADAIMDYRREFIESGDSMDGTAGLADFADFGEWFARLCDNSSEATVRPGLVPETLFMALDGEGRIVGMTDIRHRLNPHLLAVGGHIGYSVRASERRRGFATRMLALALDECRKMGLRRVLVTCDMENEASARTIIRNGGVFESEIAEKDGITERYWIEL